MAILRKRESCDVLMFRVWILEISEGSLYSWQVTLPLAT